MYQLCKDSTVIRRLVDSAWIPTVTGNIDYDEYVAWLAEGNQPLPAESSDAN